MTIDDAMGKEWDGPDLPSLKDRWQAEVSEMLSEATIPVPQGEWTADGGKQGRHTEHFGYLIAEMQHLQRVHPGLSW